MKSEKGNYQELQFNNNKLGPTTLQNCNALYLNLQIHIQATVTAEKPNWSPMYDTKGALLEISSIEKVSPRSIPAVSDRALSVLIFFNNR